MPAELPPDGIWLPMDQSGVTRPVRFACPAPFPKGKARQAGTTKLTAPDEPEVDYLAPRLPPADREVH